MTRQLPVKLKNLFLIAVFMGLLTACADEQSVILGPQYWEEFGFKVETRPSPLRVGMNEFIVIASRDEYKPGVGLVVMMRVSESDKWRQGIQDGFTGVYRRAVNVDDPATQSLTVHIRRSKGEEETMLVFPLNQKNSGS